MESKNDKESPLSRRKMIKANSDTLIGKHQPNKTQDS